MNALTLPNAPEQRSRRATLLNYFSLFSSFSTLLCCALPSVAPWLVSLSRHKIWIFSISGVLIATSFAMTYWIAPRLQQGEACAADDPTACGAATRMSKVLLWISAAVWGGGFFVAYLLAPILGHIDRP